MNGPRFDGSMGYAEDCVIASVRREEPQIDINNLEYDPEIDYRILCIAIRTDLEIGKDNALRAGFEDIADYYTILRDILIFNEGQHRRKNEYSDAWRWF